MTEIQRLNIPTPVEGQSLFLHWLTLGLSMGASPNPAFIDEDYIKLNPDLTSFPENLFYHFINHGIYEQRQFTRLARIETSPTTECHSHRRVTAIEFCHTAARESQENDEFSVMSNFLKSGKVSEIVAEAAEIEPDIGSFCSDDLQIIPPWHDRTWLGYADILDILPKGNFDALVLMPFCKLGGADFVAGVLASELSRTRRTLVVRTDAGDWARPDWFAPAVNTLDLSAHLGCFGPEDCSRILYTLILQTGAKDVFNVNSRRAFETFETFGERLAVSTRLHAYYFCADQTLGGVETGYPIWYFSNILPFLTNAMIDNTALANQLIERFSLSREMRERISVLFTPFSTNPGKGIIAERQVETTAKRKRKRILWAGRFDRQKRFDLLVEIARLMPDVDFVAWGKAVLDDPPDISGLPANLTVKKPFVDYDELPLLDSDGWLYTSAWDGIPTILIELGARGVPIVASNVGGVAEVIEASTGWPVPSDGDAQVYADTIQKMLESEVERIKRASSLQRRILDRHSKKAYGDLLEKLINQNGVEQSE